MSSMGGAGAVGASGGVSGGVAVAGAGPGGSAGGGVASGQASVTVGQAVSSAKAAHEKSSLQAQARAGNTPQHDRLEASMHVSLSPEARSLHRASDSGFDDLVAAALLAILLKQKDQEAGISAYAMAAIASYNAYQSMQSAPAMSMSS